MIALPELPGSVQMTLGTFELRTCCSDICSPQPTSLKLCASRASRAAFVPWNSFSRASTARRGTSATRKVSAPALPCSRASRVAQTNCRPNEQLRCPQPLPDTSRQLDRRAPRQLPLDQRHRDHAGLVELREHAHGTEILAQLLRALQPQLLDEIFAGDVAGAVTRLAKVEVLLESEQIERGAHPAARCPCNVEVRRLLHRELVRLGIQRAQSARRTVRQHDPLQLAGSRVVVVQARMHGHLFEAQRHAFGAIHPDVVEQGAAADRAGMWLIAHLREIPP